MRSKARGDYATVSLCDIAGGLIGVWLNIAGHC